MLTSKKHREQAEQIAALERRCDILQYNLELLHNRIDAERTDRLEGSQRMYERVLELVSRKPVVE